MPSPLRVVLAAPPPPLAAAAALLADAAGVALRALPAAEAAARAAAGDADVLVGTADDLRRARRAGWRGPAVALAEARTADAEAAAARAGAADLVTADELHPGVLSRAVRLAAALAPRAAADGDAEDATRFGVVFHAAPMGILLVGLDGRVLRANTAMHEILGHPRDALHGTMFSRHLQPEEVGDAWERFGDLVAGEVERYQVLRRYLRADGGGVWGTTTVSLARGADGAADYAIAVVENVTERVEAEEALRLREREFRSLLEHGREVVCIVDPDGGIRFTSPAVEHVLGYGRTELAGQWIGELLHPEDAGAAMGLFSRALARPGRPHADEARVRSRGGAWRRLELVATSLVDDPAVGGIVLHCRDVTDRVEAEQALRRSEQQLLQVQKMEAVGRVAGGVAHDFNNLITAIRGNAELLLMDLPADAPARADVEEIRRASDRAAALTRQLLAFSRRQVLQPRVLDLNASVAEMQKMLGRLLGEDVELVTHPAPALRPVRADPAQVEQVLLNLAVNARDAMPDGGVLVISTADAELGEEDRRRYPYVVPGAYSLLEVGDTGHGMDEATLRMAMEPFFTTKPQGRGTGLGLSTVYGIVKQSGGYVWIDSAPGKGTRVRVYLPAVSQAADEPEEAGVPRTAPARARETVLLVEDEDSVRRTTERLLARAGYTVLAAAEGAEAMALSRQHPGTIPLLVTDLVMPRMSGVDLARRLRAERPGLRVLFMSGYDRDATQENAPLERGTEFIEKPFTADVLSERVRRLLGDAPNPPSD